jgi:hypothetical protein
MKEGMAECSGASGGEGDIRFNSQNQIQIEGRNSQMQDMDTENWVAES